MGFFGRVWNSLTGQEKHRLPNQMAILGAASELVEASRNVGEEEQEKMFINFVEGRHACMLDWRAEGNDVYEELEPLLNDEEKRLLPEPDHIPEDASSTIKQIQQAISVSNRTLVRTESLGDFSFLILVPLEKEQEFVTCVGPWLISDD